MELILPPTLGPLPKVVCHDGIPQKGDNIPQKQISTTTVALNTGYFVLKDLYLPHSLFPYLFSEIKGMFNDSKE